MLKPGGRFVGEMGGFMNCIGVRATLHVALRKRGYDPIPVDPWFFPGVQEYTRLLEEGGFEVKHISLNPRFTPLEDGGVAGWMRLFARHTILGGLKDEEAKEVIEEVSDVCSVDLKDSDGKEAMMYMRLRFVAILKP